MKAVTLAGLACAVSLLPMAASANVLDDFNAATLVADFQFDDANGTTIPNAVNSVGPAMFDDDADTAGVTTNGAGQLDVSGKANTAFGSHYVDVAAISTGIVYGLIDLSWDFDTNNFNPAQDEEVRLTLASTDPRSTTVAVEATLNRDSASTVALFGNATGTGSTDTPEIAFGSSGSLLTILRADLDADSYELFYSADGGTSFLSAGTGALDPGRGVESIRLVLNEDFSDDTVLIDRFAFASSDAVQDVPAPGAGGLFALSLALLAGYRRRARRS